MTAESGARRFGQCRVLACPALAEDGNAPLELIILGPIILFLIALVIAAGRTSVAQESVAAAARDAARQASIALDPAVAQQAAESSARAALRGDGVKCQSKLIVNLAGFAIPPGQPAQVSATVICTVRLSDLLVPGVPGSRTLRATFISPLDPYRSRSLGLGLVAPTGPQARAGRTVCGMWLAGCHGTVTPGSTSSDASIAPTRGAGCDI